MLSRKAKTRLSKLADYMSRQKPEHFDMSTWMEHYGEHNHGFELETPITRRQLSSCGTTACALGFCAVSPFGRRLGLSLVPGGVYAEHVYGEIHLHGKRVGAFRAAQEVFDIDEDQAEYLFADISAETPKEWAQLCRQYIDASCRRERRGGGSAADCGGTRED